jgi:hypothetical protein
MHLSTVRDPKSPVVGHIRNCRDCIEKRERVQWLAIDGPDLYGVIKAPCGNELAAALVLVHMNEASDAY